MVIFITLLLAIVAALILALAFNWRRDARPLDTEQQERWFLRHAPSPLQRLLRSADRRVAGGSLIIVVLAVIVAAAGAVGWILSTVDHNTGFAMWDMSAAKWGAKHASPDTTRLLKWFSLPGATSYAIPILGAVGLYSWIRHKRPAMVAYLAVVGLGILLLNNVIKWTVERDRPPVPHLTSSAGTSFPSGHTATAAACWAAVAFVLSRHRHWHTRATLAALATTITVTVAASRVLLGVHWLTDVIAGSITGWGWFTLVTLLFGGRLMRFGEPAIRAAHGTELPLPTPVLERQIESESP